MGTVLDTHALIWYLSNEKKLSQKAKYAILDAEKSEIIIPVICLAEILHLSEKKRIENNFHEIISFIQGKTFFLVYDLNIDVLNEASKYNGLELHDRLIYATCKLTGYPLVSKDSMIRNFDWEVIW